MKHLNLSKAFCLGLLLLFLVCLPIYCSERQVIITESELNELESTLKQADAQLTLSKTEIQMLKNTLTEQNNQLQTLKTELDMALTLLKKSENEIRFDWLKVVGVGIGACAVGCIIGYIVRGR